MPSVKKLAEEFEEVKKGSNPQITADIEAVVVLSGESRDPAIVTTWQDTEERLAEGIKIYKKIKALGGSPNIVLNGTDPQNTFMQEESRRQGIDKILTIKNPDYPEASTKTQFGGLKDLQFKKVALVIHAAYGPRTSRDIENFLKDRKALLFLIKRNKIPKSEIAIEMQKIGDYFPEEFENRK